MLPGFQGIEIKTTPRRFQVKFWLRDAGDESAIGAELDRLRAKRKMKPTILAALRLWFDLLAGRTRLLRESFPAIVTDLERPAESAANAEFSLILEQQVAILARLEQPPALPSPAPANTPAAPRQLAAPKFDLPRIDEDEIDLSALVEIKRDTSINCAQNFINSLMALTN